MLDRMIDFVTEKMGVSFPTVPTKVEDTYLVDSTEHPDSKDRLKIAEEPKEVVLKRISENLRAKNKLPEPGKGVYHLEYLRSGSSDFILGEQVARGASARAFIDDRDHTFSKLWETNPSDEWASQNVHQKELYERLADKHPFFTYRGEFTGGWSQEVLDNQGNLQEWLDKGNKLSREQIALAVADLRQMQELAGEAHGDLVKPPELLTSFGRDQLRYQLNQLEDYGYLAVKNILVAPDGRLIFPDFAGNPDIFPLSSPGDPDNTNPKSPKCMTNELKYLQNGLEFISTNHKSEDVVG